MSKIDWTNGQLTHLTEGDTASCTGGLNTGQLYALFFYNAAEHDADTTVDVVWSNSQPPVQVTVPGTTQNQGLAALCFVSGDDTNTVSAAVQHDQPGAGLLAFIGSVKMPIDTDGIRTIELPLNADPQPFEAFTRFYAVPESHWYEGQIQSDVNQFISVQFSESHAIVNIVNATSNPSNVITYTGDTKKHVLVHATKRQTLKWPLQGNGGQTVWINADSLQNSGSAVITVQSLA